MADWKKIKTYTYAGADAASGNVSVDLQYDKDRTTPTTTYIRFKCNNTGTTWTDGFYILYNANNDPDSIGRVIRTLKSADGTWKTASSEIKITKTYTASQFSIQDFWICNTGQGTVDTSAQTVKYNSGTKSFYNWFKDGAARENWVSRFSGQKLTGTAATAVTANKPTITDNGDNTFTVKGTAGTAGTGNPVKSTSLYYYRDSESTHTKASGLSATSGLSAAAKSPSQTIYAYTKVDGTYNDAESSKVSLAIKNYQSPSNPGKPALASSSYKNSRLTVKQNWTYTWSAATATNTSSAVAGYRIRLYKNGTALTGVVCSGNSLVKGTNSNNYNDRDGTSCTVVLNPTTFGFTPGDTVQLHIHAYSKNGDGTRLFTEPGSKSDAVTVQNAGVARVRVNGAWKEGIVNVRVGGAWKEADIVKARVSGAWKESN